MPETCENWLGLVDNCIYYACYIHEIYLVLPYFEIHRVRQYLVSKCSFIMNKRPVNIENDHKAEKQLVLSDL